MAAVSAEAVGKFRFVWKAIRKFQVGLIREYKEIEKIADKLGVEKPTPLVKMEEE